MSAAIQLICESIDAIVTSDGRSVPTGALAALVRGVDATKRDGFAMPAVRAAEAFATDAHRLTLLQRRHDRGADAEADALKRRLSDACWRWVGTLPVASGLAA